MIALGSLELRHLPTIEAGPPQPMIEQSRMVSNVFPGLKLCPKEESDTIPKFTNRLLVQSQHH
jgi:hypothetical protein